MAPLRKRRSARVFVLDDEGRVLLIKHVVPRGSGSALFWAAPGGRIEEGEADHQAAERELAEELGLALPLVGPVHTSVGIVRFGDDDIENTDLFFLARWKGERFNVDAPTSLERSVLRDARWWSATGIEAAHEPIFPPDLAALLRKLT